MTKTHKYLLKTCRINDVKKIRFWDSLVSFIILLLWSRQSVLLVGKAGYVTNLSCCFWGNAPLETSEHAWLAANIPQEAGDFPSFKSSNLSDIKLRNCWTRNFRKARGGGGFAGTRALHNCDGNQSINQSPHNGSAEVRLWNTEPDRRNWGQSTRKKPTIILNPIMSCLLANQGANWLDSMTGAAISVAVSWEQHGLSHSQTLVCGARQQNEFREIRVSKAERWLRRTVA